MRLALYDVLKFVHVLAVIVWVGGGIVSMLYLNRVRKTNDTTRLGVLFREFAWVGNHVFLPASLVTLGSGIWAVIEGPWGFSDLWIILGLVGIGLTAITGSAFLGPQSKKIEGLLAEPNPPAEQILARIDSVKRIAHVDQVVLVLVVLVMVWKPTL